jgi:hypothetical protein
LKGVVDGNYGEWNFIYILLDLTRNSYECNIATIGPWQESNESIVYIVATQVTFEVTRGAFHLIA